MDALVWALTELMVAGQWFVVASQTTEHHAPARFGDRLTVRTRLCRLSRVRVAVAYEVLNQAGQRLLTAETVLASVGADLAPRRIDEAVRAALLPYLEAEAES